MPYLIVTECTKRRHSRLRECASMDNGGALVGAAIGLETTLEFIDGALVQSAFSQPTGSRHRVRAAPRRQ